MGRLQWEYLRLVDGTDLWPPIEGYDELSKVQPPPVYEAGVDWPKAWSDYVRARGEQLTALLETLGRDGWEMVAWTEVAVPGVADSHGGSPGWDRQTVVFKRPAT
jgi:hypothetical protein